MAFEIAYLTPLIQVFNMPRSLAFYRDVLGFEVVMDSGDGDNSSWVWVKKDGCHLMLNDQYEPGSEPETPLVERVRWHNDTALYIGCENVDEVFEYLTSKGLDLDPPIATTYGMRQLNLTDPDGYQICFQHEVR